MFTCVVLCVLPDLEAKITLLSSPVFNTKIKNYSMCKTFLFSHRTSMKKSRLFLDDELALFDMENFGGEPSDPIMTVGDALEPIDDLLQNIDDLLA